MRLITAHRILIGTAIAGCLAYAAWATWSPRAAGGWTATALAATALAVAVVLGLYLRWLSRKG